MLPGEYKPVGEAVLPRPVVVHVSAGWTGMATWFWSNTVAVNCWVAPMLTVGVVGESLIDVGTFPTKNFAAFDVPPPGLLVTTVIRSAAACTVSALVIVAVRMPVL